MQLKNRKLPIVFIVLIIATIAFLIYWSISRGKSKIVISEEAIEYIMLEGYEVQIGNTKLNGEINKRVDDDATKKKLVEYINSLGVIKHYRQGDPILGTPSYQIKVFLEDESTITFEEGGIIVVENHDGEQWYDSKESFQEMFYEMYMK